MEWTAWSDKRLSEQHRCRNFNCKCPLDFLPIIILEKITCNNSLQNTILVCTKLFMDPPSDNGNSYSSKVLNKADAVSVFEGES
ncbi:hypothetical protein CEXT_215721 [Caerostris extrusa]|uniref:Uncharacterized protein n=1 Tax=Caerostris extrusa TaxID=172846 RepID=A0AAV4VJB6_CAEEX|nr:hypothetical protein CEXT_215721 [Caerostris extrusa]